MLKLFLAKKEKQTNISEIIKDYFLSAQTVIHTVIRTPFSHNVPTKTQDGTNLLELHHPVLLITYKKLFVLANMTYLFTKLPIINRSSF
jgi:hypothetical protein